MLEVKTQLKKLKNKKGTGLDKMKPELYKAPSGEQNYVNTITGCYNNILENGEIRKTGKHKKQG